MVIDVDILSISIFLSSIFASFCFLPFILRSNWLPTSRRVICHWSALSISLSRLSSSSLSSYQWDFHLAEDASKLASLLQQHEVEVTHSLIPFTHHFTILYGFVQTDRKRGQITREVLEFLESHGNWFRYLSLSLELYNYIYIYDKMIYR